MDLTQVRSMKARGMKQRQLVQKPVNEKKVVEAPVILSAEDKAKIFCKTYATANRDVEFPLKLLFEDYLCLCPKKTIILSNWLLAPEVFTLIAKYSKMAKVIRLDNANFDIANLSALKGFQKLNVFSLVGNYTIDVTMARLFASWPTLTEINISDCTVNSVEVFRVISHTCSRLKTLICQRTVGIDDYGLIALGECILRYRSLRNIDFSGCIEISDEGMLQLLVTGPNIICSLSLRGCRHLSSLCIAGLRKRMSVLEKLDVSNMNIGQSSFEWISEGCRMLRVIDCTNSQEIDDAALGQIGLRCHALEELHLSKCVKISNAGIVEFFKVFEGKIVKLDIGSCIQCTSAAAVAIGLHSQEITDLTLSGLSQMTAESIHVLWKHAVKLVRFDMSVELRSTASHRRSMIPHICDSILKTNSYSELTEVHLAGACLVTDLGACSIAVKCKKLVYLDVSYCNGVTDLLLRTLAIKSKCLSSLLVSGCVHITDVGVEALCLANEHHVLKRLEVNGCQKVTDRSVLCIAEHLRHIESLGIRNCDAITNASLVVLSQECQELKHLDVGNLDLVDAIGITAIARTNKHLTMFNCESCSVTSIEFANILKDRPLPLAEPAHRSCRIQPKPRNVLEFNKYVLKVRDHDVKCKIIQRLVLGINYCVWLKMLQLNKRFAARSVQRMFRGIRARARVNAIKAALALEFRSATRLQKGLRRIIGIHTARLKAAYLRRNHKARTTMQRCFRGYASRKRTKRRFRVLWSYYRKIGHLVHKYWVVCAARKLHSQIVKVQSIVRRFIRWLEYRNTLQGFTEFQVAIKDWVVRRKCVHLFVLNPLITGVEQRSYAARLISRMFINRRFNRMVVPFTVYCAQEWRRVADDEEWHSSRIQKQWRGYNCRVKLAWERWQPKRFFNAATMVQCRWRLFVARRRYGPFRKWKKKMTKRWRKLWMSIPQLELGTWTKVIQRTFRRYLFIIRRAEAAVVISRSYRHYKARVLWKALVIGGKYIVVCRITRFFRLVKAKSEMREKLCRRHMAAWCIQTKVRANFDEGARKRMFYQRRLKQNQVAATEKLAMAHARKVKSLEKIKSKWRNRMANRIQRVYRKWKSGVLKRKEAARNRAAVRAEAKQDIEELKEIQARANLEPTALMAKAMNQVAAIIMGKEEALVTTKDQIRCVNSVLKFQTQSIKQEGIVSLHLSQGAEQAVKFMKQQILNKAAHEPYYEQISVDMSGPMEWHIYMWYLKGSGPTCLTQLEIKTKPYGLSVSALKARAKHMLQDCVLCVWDKECHIELQAQRTIQRGQGGYPIQEIKVCTNKNEEEAAIGKGFTQVAALGDYGLPIAFTVYMYRRVPVEDEAIYEMRSLNMFEWMDARLLRCSQAFNMNVEEIMTFRRVYEGMLPRKNATTLDVSIIFDSWSLPQTVISKWVVAAINPDEEKRVTFSEYVHFLSSYIMLAKRDLIKFVFGHMDTGARCYLTQEQFSQTLEHLLESTVRNKKLYELKYTQYADPYLKYMMLQGFEAFVNDNLSVIWTTQFMQTAFMEFNLGTKVWQKKLEQFRIVRQGINAVQQN